MKPFDNVQSVAASINENDLDTDIIFPARFLLLLDKKGLGEHAFHERRAAPDTAPFVLDLPPFDKAEILVAARNFGTGSSREQAVWALADFGIRVVIAESFGEIFYANCFKNGVLPIAADKEDLMRIRASAEAGEMLTVDLLTQSITLTSGPVISFDIPPHRKEALLRGLDDIGSILANDADDIAAFEQGQRQKTPWLYLSTEQLSYFNDLERETALGRPGKP